MSAEGQRGKRTASTETDWWLGAGLWSLVSALLVVGLAAWVSRIDAGHFTLRLDASSRIGLAAPAYLSLFGVAPLLWFMARRSRREGVPASLRRAALGLRMFALAALAVALAEPFDTEDATDVATVILIDESGSAEGRGFDEARAVIDEWMAQAPSAPLFVVGFARRPRLIDPVLVATQKVPPLPDRDDLGHSDLERALQFARGLFPVGHLRRLVLISDGLQTRGDLLALRSSLAADGVRLFHITLPPSRESEVAVTAMHVPSPLKPSAAFEVVVQLAHRGAQEVEVALYQNDRPNAMAPSRTVSLGAGDGEVQQTDVRFAAMVPEPGPVSFRAEVRAKSDVFAENNTFRTAAQVQGRPRALIVDSEPGRMSSLARALEVAQWEPVVRGPRGLPTQAGELARFEAVILSDVPAAQVPAATQAALAQYVSSGGLLFMAGGAQGYALGGWQSAPLAKIIPLRMDSERRRDQPALGLCLVIDKSGSMAGQKIELAKEAAKQTAALLSPMDVIGVIGFDAAPETIVRMQSAANQGRVQRDLGRLAPRGGTAIFPALDAAYQALSVTRASLKHVILLTDGQSPEDGIEALVRTMRADGITVSTVGLGHDVHRALLSRVADLGGGRAYFTSDPYAVPRIFMQETQTVARSSVVEDYVGMRVREDAVFLRGLPMDAAPMLRGYVATQPRGGRAQVVLESDLGEPLLARMRHGAGWSLAFTSDLKPRWSSAFLGWSRFPQWMAQTLRAHMYQAPDTPAFPMTVQREGNGLVVAVQALDRQERFVNDLTSSLTVQRDGAPVASDIPMVQVSPGRYEARVEAAQVGLYALRAVHRRGERVVAQSEAQYSMPFPPEYARLAADSGLMEALSQGEGQGRYEGARALLEARGQHVPRTRAWYGPCVGLALALMLLGVAVRRLPGAFLLRATSTSPHLNT